ncbi:hypothetical protein BCU68_04150 [Vibrio sp. 10N.286.49.B3]|uniref:DUF406 family protein n=1 Tax=Vibrio sp. 10N.286.49.B3 TaxID=1880855 RepID=UPI000C84C0A1|nr:DUF406 family protein [Vibrio sp. 10N.286.49.B3]PMH43188.1 hypothetical protein BCU68_04150 [Vibrio sp. 10N.286.49.B3]
MSIEENTVCEACGCAGEIGFIIKEGDETSEIIISAASKALIDVEFDKYLALAQEACAGVKYEKSELTEASTQLTARFQFDVSAEKIIFELKTRSLRR